MKTLKDYEAIIKETVKKINDADPNWKWSIKDITEWKACIRWEYLDYCQEKDNCFFVTMTPPDEYDEIFITARDPKDTMIDGYFAVEDVTHSWQSNLENSIINAIEVIAYHAHECY